MLTGFCYRSIAQDSAPATDIWLAQLKKNASGILEVSTYKKISDNPGYDNQPYFVPSLNSLLYVADRNQGQTDIYQFDLSTGNSKRVLSTEYYKEYSPMLSYDEKQISCVSIEPDGSSQRFWQFPFGGGMGKPMFPEITDIGYYSWIDENNLAFFRTNDTALYLANSNSEEMKRIDKSVGRCMIKAKNHDWLYYVKKYDSLNWKIKCYDLSKSVLLGEIKLPIGEEDFTLGPNDVVWLSNEGKIQEASLQNPKWKTVFDFSNYPFKNFYRLVYSTDFNMLAFVTYEGKKP